MDFDSVYNFGKTCDLVTYEIEHINVEALEKLEKEGIKVFPNSSTLRIIQDKSLQKKFFIDNNIPSAKFKFYLQIPPKEYCFFVLRDSPQEKLEPGKNMKKIFLHDISPGGA